VHNDITNADGLVIAANFVDSGSTAEFLWTEIGTGITTDASVLFQYMYALLWRRACRRGGTLSEREHHTWAFVSDLSAVRKGEQIFKCAVAQLVRLVSWRRRTSAKYQPGGATQRREMWQLQTCNSWDVLINTLEPYSSSSGSLFSSNYSLTLVCCHGGLFSLKTTFHTSVRRPIVPFSQSFDVARLIRAATEQGLRKNTLLLNCQW